MFEKPSHHQSSTFSRSPLFLARDPVSPQCFLSPSVRSSPLIRFPLYSFQMCCNAATHTCGESVVSADLPSSPAIASVCQSNHLYLPPSLPPLAHCNQAPHSSSTEKLLAKVIGRLLMTGPGSVDTFQTLPYTNALPLLSQKSLTQF